MIEILHVNEVNSVFRQFVKNLLEGNIKFTSFHYTN